MSHRSAGPAAGPFVAASLALAVLSCGSAAAAHGRSQTEALAAPPCGASSSALADPADTQRCLAARYKPPKPKSRAAAMPASTAPPSKAGA